eukprot:COSAG02_NODE_2355_length_9073_cov_3.811901_3_plen_744_part_00
MREWSPCLAQGVGALAAMAGRVIGLAVAAGVGAVTTLLTRRLLLQSEQLSSASPGRKGDGRDGEAVVLRTEARGQQGKGDEKWRARCRDLEAKLAKASAETETAQPAPPGLEKLSKLGREKRLQREGEGAAPGSASDASTASSSDADSDGDPVPENAADEDYIEGVGNVGEARDAYRKYMGQGKNTSAFGKGGGSKKRLVAALEDKKKADAAEDSLHSLREEIVLLREQNATLNAKLDGHDDAEPRAHKTTEYTATASAVRLLRPLHGEWVLVAGSDSHVDVVADEYEPSHKELHSSQPDSNDSHYKAFRVVVSDTHTKEVLLNEYIALETAFRVASPCFHALTTTRGFEYGLQFHTEEDADAIYAAVTAARKYMARQSSAERIPCLVKAWQEARGAVDHGALPAASEQPNTTQRNSNASGRARVEILLPEPEQEHRQEERDVGAGGTLGSTVGARPRQGSVKFTKEVEDHYFDYYSAMSNQQLMLEDSVRTTTYMEAIMQNAADFEGKVVVDVGAGSGILSFFAARAGAAKVYAIEASTIAEVCRSLVEANGLSGVIEVVHGTVEGVELPEQADVLISEPMGFMLFHEQMLDSFVLAREKFLRPGGKVFPTKGTMYCGPVCDAEMHSEQVHRANFWNLPQGLYGKVSNILPLVAASWCLIGAFLRGVGVDVSAMQAVAERSHFASAISDIVMPEMMPCGIQAASKHVVDFTTATPDEFDDIKVGDLDHQSYYTRACISRAKC